MLSKIYSCKQKVGRTRRSSQFTLFTKTSPSDWDDYQPAFTFSMGRWSGPLLALALGFGADITRSRCQGWGLRWFLWTSLKTICDQAVFWSVAGRMPNPLDFLSARMCARVFQSICRYMIKPGRWSCVSSIGLWGLIEIGMLRTMPRHLVVFYTHRLLMSMLKPTLFTAGGKEWWWSELLFLGKGILEWGVDELIHIPISFLTTIFWPDFALMMYGGIRIPPLNI